MLRKVKAFFKTPKGLVLIILSLLTAASAPHEGLRLVAAGMGSASLLAGLADSIILRLRKNVWEFPSGAVLTAMIVAMVLRAQEAWYVPACTSLIAVLSKYVIRSRSANVFNPAALAMVASFYLFDAGQSWWGALTELPIPAKVLLVAAGLFITDRVNKMPLVLTFLAAYFTLFTAVAFLGDPLPVAEIFRTPDAEAALYFAFIILTDPPTSPAKYPDQIICGLIVATVSFAFFELFGLVYFLLAGVLAGNVWEAWRRVNRRSDHSFPSGLGSFLWEISPWRPQTAVLPQ